ncbi:hypothetical protein Scep_002907 [Stephania cephalantha]|uniref:K Homology domain-containing protein n=1 Tax=Stephania cephalantha TaxID=152367 RepID=A0AAP0LB34_9MAGN
MGDRIQPGSFFQYSPSGLHGHPSPHRPPSSAALDRDSSRYLAELLAERQKLGPFIQVLPHCTRLINQEIVRASGMVQSQSFLDHERIEHESPLRSSNPHINGGPMDLEGWPMMQREYPWLQESEYLQRLGRFQVPSSPAWPGAPGVANSSIVKKVIRLDVPVDDFPSYNFVGRLLGPRGNSLKRVEATTQCRVYIRGRGSVKDSVKEEKLRDKPGYEHLNEPLHVLVEAEFPADEIDAHLDQAVSILETVLKPVDESMDYYKKNQLRELALLNGTLREESPSMSPSMSPFNATGMKRAKTGM